MWQTTLQSLTRSLQSELKRHLEQANTRCFQTLYLFAFWSGWFYIFTFVFPMVNNSITVGSLHKQLGVVVFLCCLASWSCASFIGPGNITAQSMSKYDNYHYDNFLFFNRTCKTLKIRKLPRSKFDRVSQTHVPRFDHFCPVLVQAVGEENYRFFLLFLATHIGMCVYGCTVLSRLLWGIVLEEGEYKSLLTAKLGFVTFARRVAAVVLLNHPIGYLVLLLFVIAVALSAFLWFHVCLIARGMTTNEFHKWADIKDEIELHFKRRRTRDVEAQGNEARTRSALPRNSYNLGLLKNVYEVLFPRCFQRENSIQAKDE